MARKIIIDTDPGVDDVLAILLLLASPEVSIELISVTFGNTTLDRAFLNILKMYGVARRHLVTHEPASPAAIFPNLTKEKPTILARGASRPIEGSLDLAEYFHGFDGLSNISKAHPEFKADLNHPDESLSITEKPGHEAILELLAAEPPGTVTILALGPLTTVAQALQKDPKTFGRVAQVVSMGGAIDVPGNTSPTAEFNLFADPYGAEIVMRGATKGLFDMVLVPLDVTTKHTVHYDKLIRRPNTDKSSDSVLYDFLDAILSPSRVIMRDLGYTEDVFEMHDPLAAYYVIDNATDHPLGGAESKKPRWKTAKRIFLMERTGEWTKGTCVVDRRPTQEVAGNVRARDGIPHEQEGAAKASSTSNVEPRAESHGLDISITTETPGALAFEALFLARVYQVKK